MAETFDGAVESAAILARLSGLCGGRVTHGMRDDTPDDLFPDGTIKPRIEVLYGLPIPAAQDRGLGGERVQPHILVVSVVTEAADVDTADSVNRAALALLLDWEPSTKASGMKPAGASSFPIAATDSKPSRQITTTRYTTTINL